MADAWAFQVAEAMLRKIREAALDEASWEQVPGPPVRVDHVQGPADLNLPMPSVLIEAQNVPGATHAAPGYWAAEVEVVAYCLLKAGPEAHRAVHNMAERVGLVFRAQLRGLEFEGESLVASGSFQYSGYESKIELDPGKGGHALAIVKGLARRKYQDAA